MSFEPGGGDQIEPSMWNPDAEPVYNQSGVATGQPPQFRATRKPEPMVARPDFPATAENANGVLIQENAPHSSERPWLSKIYLFVDAVETSWQVAGEFGQAMTARVWYPRNFIQGDWTIEGTVANQYEFDKLVEFVQQHQQSILQAWKYRGDDYLQLFPAKFMLFKPANLIGVSDFKMIPGGINPGAQGNRVDTSPPGALPPGGHKDTSRFLLYLAITHMEAGHERFRFAPAFTLTAKVLGDLWQDSKVIFGIPQEGDITATAIFGDLEQPQTSPINFSASVNTEPPIDTSPPGSMPPSRRTGLR